MVLMVYIMNSLKVKNWVLWLFVRFKCFFLCSLSILVKLKKGICWCMLFRYVLSICWLVLLLGYGSGVFWFSCVFVGVEIFCELDLLFMGVLLLYVILCVCSLGVGSWDGCCGCLWLRFCELINLLGLGLEDKWFLSLLIFLSSFFFDNFVSFCKVIDEFWI